jgi:hypothetical protein
MKYMITWSERSPGSPIEYENAQADSGGLHSTEGARQLQDRDVRHTSGGLGRVSYSLKKISLK